MKTLHDNPFYDFVFASVDDLIPSTRTGFKNCSTLNPESPSVGKFREQLKGYFQEYPDALVPFKSRVLISLSIGLKQKEYEKIDIDNMTKSLIDAFKGIAYENDIQVDVLHVVKYKSDDNRWNVGIKGLKDDDLIWYYPPLYLESPYGLINASKNTL